MQAVLQTEHIKHFWEQHTADPDVQQTEALLMASLQVSLLPSASLFSDIVKHPILQETMHCRLLLS